MQGIVIPLHRGLDGRLAPRGRQRGLFRGDLFARADESATEDGPSRAPPSLRGLETAMESLAPRFGRGAFFVDSMAYEAQDACHHGDNERLGTTGD